MSEREILNMIAPIHYEPSEPGATTWREAKPLYIDGKHITAELYQGILTIFKGTKVIYEGPAPEGVPTGNQMHAWIADFAISYEIAYAHSAPQLAPLHSAVCSCEAHDVEPSEDRPSDANVKVAQMAWDTHKAVACSQDSALCNATSPVYKASRKLALATLRTVYGLSAAKALRVYDVLIESGFSVSGAVRHVRDNG